jgi:cation diffusion facilitator CzcD-associated flavoprotein CzcO
VTNQYDLTERRPHSGAATESIETIVIGGGQAGLSVGYYLAKLGRPFVILDANERTGDSWRNRWDSLLLFTPARINGLPGMRFPASGGTFVTKAKWPTISRLTRLDSRCRFDGARRSTG